MKRALIAALVMMLGGCCLLTVTSEEFPSWVSAQGTAPVSGGYGEAIVGEGQNIFLIKCLYASSTPELYRYSVTSSTWYPENAANLPTGTFRNGTALAWDGADCIYALAGARYKDTFRTVFLQYRVEEAEWHTLPNTPFAQGAGDALTWSGYDSSLYAFVGSAKHNGERSHFLRYDPVASTWSKLPFPFGWSNTDDGAALVWTGAEYIYALRGEYDEKVPNGDFERFYIPSQTWEQLPPLPAAGGVGDGGSLLWIGAQLPEYQDFIFALSGGTALEAPGYGFYRYSISLDEWEPLGDIPCPVGHYVGNRLAYAAGSLYYWQGSPTSDKWVCKGAGFYQIPLTSPSPQPRTCLEKLNRATYGDFHVVYGIGDVLAQRLVDAQPFASIYDLDNVSGIGPVKMRAILDYFCPIGS